MISVRPWIASALAVAALGLARPPAALAQDKPRDEALDKLLEKLDEKAKPEPAKPDEKGKGDAKDKKPAEAPPKGEDLDKLLEKLDAKAKADPAQGKPVDKKPGEVAPKDEALDKLLEGLGQAKDAPSPDDKKPGQPGPEMPPPPDGSQPKPDNLKGGEKELDQELERITGKKPKPKNQRERKSEEETGPLGQVIKEMRDVEQRLGQPDTGEATRQKQAEIVKNLDTLIEQIKNAPSQSMAMKMIRDGKKPGQPQKPGQPGQQPGAMADGAQPTKPADPKKNALPSDLAKSIWGQLPTQLREEMGNVLNERALPSKEDLIRLYYLSLGNKNANRED